MGQQELTRNLIEKGILHSHNIIEAFKEIDRADFVSQDYKDYAYRDQPLPIGSGQTISQPTTVAFMLEKLQPQSGEAILDVGSGSAWTTALLSHLTEPDGTVVGVEIVPELVEFGRKNLAKYNFENTMILEAGNKIGYEKSAPYDRILVSAAGDEIPDELIIQLKPGGVLIIPVGSSIFKIHKQNEGELSKEEFPGFVFVPLR